MMLPLIALAMRGSIILYPMCFFVIVLLLAIDPLPLDVPDRYASLYIALALFAWYIYASLFVRSIMLCPIHQSLPALLKRYGLK